MDHKLSWVPVSAQELVTATCWQVCFHLNRPIMHIFGVQQHALDSVDTQLWLNPCVKIEKASVWSLDPIFDGHMHLFVPRVNFHSQSTSKDFCDHRDGRNLTLASGWVWTLPLVSLVPSQHLMWCLSLCFAKHIQNREMRSSCPGGQVNFIDIGQQIIKTAWCALCVGSQQTWV